MNFRGIGMILGYIVGLIIHVAIINWLLSSGHNGWATIYATLTIVGLLVQLERYQRAKAFYDQFVRNIAGTR